MIKTRDVLRHRGFFFFISLEIYLDSPYFPLMTFEKQSETLGFEAEVSQLLELVAKSLYSNKEIFLRELISNASDAADKLRYEGLSDTALYEDDSELKITIEFDAEHHTLTIRDNGIGMSREEAIENLGTIAKSGTRAFRDMLSGDKSHDSQLIGQFGVGFYSTFMVADKVEIITKSYKDEPAAHWTCDGSPEFSLEPSKNTAM